MRLNGSYIVTGAASGLGRSIAAEIAAAGGTPVVFDVNPVRNGTAYEAVDVTDGRRVDEAVERVHQNYGELQGIVANAGVDACGEFTEVSREAWERVIAVNLFGTANLVRAALPFLKASHGRIVTVASTLGLRALPAATAYCASKFAVVGFTRALSAELQGQVGVTLLLPGAMATSFFDGRDPKYQPAADAPLNDPANVAQLVVTALAQPEGCDVREMLVCPSVESSWP